MRLYQLVKKIQQKQLKRDIPKIIVGDTIRMGVVIQERNKQRVQIYQGTLIAQHRAGRNSSITVRRVFQGVGVERIFLLHSPLVQNIEILRHAKIRRAKLYYLRSRKGKAVRLRERFLKTKSIILRFFLICQIFFKG
jgi:large subunit ribosomal protein L19